MFSQTSSSSLAAAACTLFVAVSASPDAFPFTNEPAHQLVNRADVIITTGATGGVQPRLEISNLATRDDQWALYIKAMAKWQQAGSDDTSGYYGIASVHGVPLEDWNGAKQCDTCTDATGYGAHDMVIFPTWHRTYLAQFEQDFLATALEVAESYPASSRERMVAAQKTLRFPYWDWASTPESNSSCLPEIISSPQITINGPDGAETLDNPLYSFTFTEAEAQANYYSVFTSWLQTYRYPASDAVNTTSSDSSAVSAFDGMQGSLQDQVYQMLTACDDYLHFSNDEAGATSKCANSLETIHNTVHTLAGGAGSDSVSGGHLTYLPLSSYDPVFWLHHANVDRLFALWQTINPDSWVPSATVPHDTWVIPSGASLNGDYPLEPFNKDSSSYWTSYDVRDWTQLGYTYPEFTTSNGDKSSIATYINGLYGNKPTLSAGDISAQVPETEVNTTTTSSSVSGTRGTNSTSGTSGTSSGTSGGLLGGLLNLTIPSVSLPSYPQSTGTASVGGGLGSLLDGIVSGMEQLAESFIDSVTGNAYEYACNIQTPRYALNGSYTIYVFNGEPSSESPSTWLSASNLLGVMGVLAAPEYMHHDTIVTGQIPLTKALRGLVTLGSLLGMSEDNILPFLTKNLQWRISLNGQEVDVSSVEGFAVAVYSSQASVPKAAGELPSYSKYAPCLNVTSGKTGGASEAIFGPAGDNSTSVASSYGSGSSSAATWAATQTSAPSYSSGSSSAATWAATQTSAPWYGSESSAPTYEASSSASSSAAGAYSYGSYAPSGSASPYVSLSAPSSWASAPSSVIPSAFESSATASQAASTCAVVTTTVKHVQTIYVTESASATASVYSASAPVWSGSASAPVYTSAPVYSAPSAPKYNATSSVSIVTVVPIPSTSSVENSPVMPSEYSSAPVAPVAPYPTPSGSSPAYYPTGSGSPVAPVYATGTGKVYPTAPSYTGAANAMNAAGFVAGLGAFAAFFM